MVDCNLEGCIKKVSILMWRTLFARLVLCSVILLLSACSMMTDRNSGTSEVATGTGGIGTKDGAPAVSIDVAEISDVQPHPVVRTIAGNKSPYVVFGKRYTVLEDSHGFRQRGTASWYGTKFHGRRTSNGEVYNMYAMTAAHKTLPIPSYVKVTNLDNQRSIIVRVNDRGPFHGDRIIDLSYAAAKKLGYVKLGVAPVIVEDVTPKADDVITTKNADTTFSSSIAVSSTPAYLQVGAFRESQTAETLRTKLLLTVSHPVSIARTDDNWYRVRVGPVLTAQAVSHLRQNLERQGHANLHVIYE